MAENTQAVFTPAGGMNQDDSIITPSAGAAGNSLFGAGDYRYALNARIGSSNRDNFGDLENIKDTLLVENFLVRQQLFTNSEFDGSLEGWSILSAGGPNTWQYFEGYFFGDDASIARLIYPSLDILYQPVAVVAGQTYNLTYNYGIGIPNVSGFKFVIVFLNGTTEIGAEIIDTTTGVVTGSASVTIPSGCNAVGFRVDDSLLTGIKAVSNKLNINLREMKIIIQQNFLAATMIHNFKVSLTWQPITNAK